MWEEWRKCNVTGCIESGMRMWVVRVYENVSVRRDCGVMESNLNFVIGY